MVMKTKNSLYVCANLRIKNLSNINIARLYCVFYLNLVRPSWTGRSPKMGMEFWMWLSQEEANKS